MESISVLDDLRSAIADGRIDFHESDDPGKRLLVLHDYLRDQHSVTTEQMVELLVSNRSELDQFVGCSLSDEELLSISGGKSTASSFASFFQAIK